MRRGLSNRWKYGAMAVGAGLFAYAACLAFGQFWVIRVAQPYTYAGIDEVPGREVALVPGVGASYPGRPPRNLLERLRVALALYRAHKVGAILISGVADGSPRDEMVEMRRWLGFRGVPSERIISDPGGYRTFDTMWRASNVLRVSGAIVCTQVGNMSRSLFLARSVGIDAVGLVAPSRNPTASVPVWRQDALKAVLALLDTYVLHRQPKLSDARGVIDPRPLVVARAEIMTEATVGPARCD